MGRSLSGRWTRSAASPSPTITTTPWPCWCGTTARRLPTCLPASIRPSARPSTKISSPTRSTADHRFCHNPHNQSCPPPEDRGHNLSLISDPHIRPDGHRVTLTIQWRFGRLLFGSAKGSVVGEIEGSIDSGGCLLAVRYAFFFPY